MEEFSFHGLGTQWSVSVQDGPFLDEEKKQIVSLAERFEKRFSRFRPDSEVNAFRESSPGAYEISEELFILLERADELRTITRGAYDPAVAGLLERAGYGTLQKATDTIENFVLPKWSLKERKLSLDGPISFDLGGIGKGYCIDRIATLLSDLGHQNFLVEGGGDMYATEKKDGEPWRVAVEYPGRPEEAAGLVELRHQGLAASDRYRRRFGGGDWHHVVDWETKAPRDAVLGCAAVASNAWDADCMTSGLFLGKEEDFLALKEAFQAEYLVFYPGGRALHSAYWRERLFS